MNILKELFAKLHIAREHMTSEYRLREAVKRLDDKMLFLMDNLLDISAIKPATGRMRLRQEISVQILRLVDAVATRKGIPYWLDFGTLLGAIRHQGFIPWDDDIDISMRREDMNTFISVKDELPTCISVTSDPIINLDIDPVLHIFEKRSRCFVDIFPYDFISGALTSSGSETEWAKMYKKSFDEVNVRHRYEIFAFRDKWLAEHPTGEGDVDALAVGLDYASAAPNYRNLIRYNKVFPLRKVVFEGCPMNAPLDVDDYLSQIYGDYMHFPKDAGAPKHMYFDSAVSSEELRVILDDLSQEVKHLSA